MSEQPTRYGSVWHVDEQQESFVRAVFDLDVHGVVDVALSEIDVDNSLAVGQNRKEMVVDSETVELLSMYMDDGVSLPMPLVHKRDMRAKRYTVLDGNHRIAAARKRGDTHVSALLLVGDTKVASQLALVVNTQHGRSTRDPDYVARTMRRLREQGLNIPTIARMFAVSESAVAQWTRRDAQIERVAKLIPERRTRVKAGTLDMLHAVEDAHLLILGDLFLDAPQTVQEDAISRLRAAPSSERDAVAHEVKGALDAADRERRKVRAHETRPSSTLQSALSRLVSVKDPTSAYFDSSDHQKAIIRSQLDVVMPKLGALVHAIRPIDVSA